MNEIEDVKRELRIEKMKAIRELRIEKMKANRQEFNAFIEKREVYFANFITKLNNLNTELLELLELLKEEKNFEDNLENINSKRLEITIAWGRAIEEEKNLNKNFEISNNEDVYNISKDISKIIEEKLEEIKLN